MSNLLDPKVSVFKGTGIAVVETIPLGTMLQRIQTGYYGAQVANVRQVKATASKEAYKAAKATLPSFTPCCALTTRDKDKPWEQKLVSCTGLVHFDFDQLEDPADFKQQLTNHRALVFAFVSPGGDGVKAGFAVEGITGPDTYRLPWQYVLRRLKQTYPAVGINEDPHVKFLHALCFVSDDPDLYTNAEAAPLTLPPAPPPLDEGPPDGPEAGTPDYATVTSALAAIPEYDTYDEWLKIGMGLHSTQQPWARAAWDSWSAQSTKFAPSVQQQKWKGFSHHREGAKIHIGYVLTLASKHGWKHPRWGQGASQTHSGITSLPDTNFLAEKYPRLDKDSCGEEAPQAFTSFSSYKEWPTLGEEAFYGVAGEIVRAIAPHTEADPVALLSQLLTYHGTVCGRGAYHTVGATQHHSNLFACLVGASSRGRKGSAFDHIQACVLPIDHTDFTWSYDNIIGGCGSGEGVIATVRDPIMRHEPIKEKGRVIDYQDVEVDPGVSDKRLLIYEAEFSSVLKVCNREHNLLSEVLRKAWETGHLRNTTKTAPLKATGAHISLIGHITLDELQKTLTTTAVANGFANRILWICVKRHGRLPEGGALEARTLADIRSKFRTAVRKAATITSMIRDEQAKCAWNAVWDALTEDRPGLVGCLLARAEAQVLRLSMIYALLDGSAVITHCHLNAALALWQYVEASVWYLFGTSLGDPTADTVLAALDQTPKGLTRNHLLTQTLHGNCRADELDRVLRLLERLKLVTILQQNTGRRGRPAELITRTPNEVNEVNTPDYVSMSNNAVKRADFPRSGQKKNDEENTTEGFSATSGNATLEACLPYNSSENGHKSEAPPTQSDGPTLSASELWCADCGEARHVVLAGDTYGCATCGAVLGEYSVSSVADAQQDPPLEGPVYEELEL